MKTHLLTRKRALISSVAMLLVAIIALGTATFAWFTKSTTIMADSITVKTIKSSELQIRGASGENNEWNSGFSYNANQILKPVSTADCENWYIANAKTKDFMTADMESASKLTAQYDHYYFVDRLDIRNNGTADVEKVKVTVSLGQGFVHPEYVRVALVPCSATGEITKTGGSFTLGSTTVCTKKASAVYDAVKGIKTKVVGDKTVNDSFETVSVTTADKMEFNVGTIKGKTTTTEGVKYDEKYYKVFVWFEGQDENCKDSNAGAEITGMSLSVSGNTVEQLN